MKQKVRNTIALMSLYQKEYSFKGVVFTKSAEVTKVAKSFNLSVIPRVLRNHYRLPYIRNIFQKMKKRINSRYYGYINSDILLHPRVFELLPIINTKMKNQLLSNRIELLSRVKMTNMHLTENDFTSLNKVYEVFEKANGSKLRSELSIVSL